MSEKTIKVVIVDLNNFARYPTLPIGYLSAILRSGGFQVDVFSPLASGVGGIVREGRAKPWGLIDQKLRYWSAHSSNVLVKSLREELVRRRSPALLAKQESVFRDFKIMLDRIRPDAVLISTYLMYRELCADIANYSSDMKIPVLVGGPYFSQPEVRQEWLSIPGITGLVGGEVEGSLSEIVKAMVGREEIDRFPGVFLPGEEFGGRGVQANPWRDLDSLPFPDFNDFPWERYPNRIVPVIAGRGCGWGACTFCSDITSTAGRTFRSRRPEKVLEEIEFQYRTLGAKLFAFVDLKLNSDLTMWWALLDGFQKVAPGAQWIASVHVGKIQPNGLSSAELKRAKAAGMLRLTTGLESGSQRILDDMAKGSDLNITSQFLRDAAAAGISVRTTMILGYPGENADDVEQSARFVRDHFNSIERIMLNRFAITIGTSVHRAMQRNSSRFHGLRHLSANNAMASVDHSYDAAKNPNYQKAVGRLMLAVHKINRKHLKTEAQQFEGVM